MPFTKPAIFFRTEATKQSVTADPSNLPAAQILEFTDNSIVEVVDNKYQNNVSIDPVSNPDGVKKAVLQDNGRLEDSVTIAGIFNLANDSALITKLKTFSRKLQIETSFHKFGIFGLAYPVATTFSLDPSDTVGLYIDNIDITAKGQTKGIIAFTIVLKTGGTLV